MDHLSSFWDHLGDHEQTGTRFGLLGFIMCLVLLSSCTAEDLCPECEPDPFEDAITVIGTANFPPLVSDLGFVPDTTYAAYISCSSEASGLVVWDVEFNLDGTVTLTADPGPLGQMAAATYQQIQVADTLYWMAGQDVVCTLFENGLDHLEGWTDVPCAIIVTP